MFSPLRRPGLWGLVFLIFATMPGLPAPDPRDHPLRPVTPVPPHDPDSPFRARAQGPSTRRDEHLERVRLCSRQWRERKARGEAKGQGWVDFARDCRDRLKAAGH